MNFTDWFDQYNAKPDRFPNYEDCRAAFYAGVESVNQRTLFDEPAEMPTAERGARRTDPETSHEHARKVKEIDPENISKLLAAILEIIDRQPRTDKEIVRITMRTEGFQHYDPNTPRRQCTTLRQQGFIEWVEDHTREPDSDKILYRERDGGNINFLTQKGINALRHYQRRGY